MLTKILLVALYDVMCWPSMWHYCLVSPLNTPEFSTSFVTAKHRFVKLAHYLHLNFQVLLYKF